MSVFSDTFQACQQLTLLGAEGAAAAQAARDFEDVGVVSFLRGQQDALRRAGQRADLGRPHGSASRASLLWKLPGRTAHPRDSYVLEVGLDGDTARARFLGPRSGQEAFTLATRRFDPATLERWTITFYEWALACRETR